ncbi:MAG: Uma2 family endonuclease [Microcystaceae cyanobacterium]
MTQTIHQSPLLSLTLPDQLCLKVTPEQFASLARVNRELRLERTATGDLIVNPPTGGQTGHRNFNLTTQLGIWFEANDHLGRGFDSSTGFELPNGANRSPDVSWICQERWESLTDSEREGFIPLCPDFVLELRSKSDRLPDLRAKMQEYLDNGARLGWLIDPLSQRVEIYRPGQTVEVVDNSSTLSGESVLPRFTLSLKRIFVP